MRGGDEVNDHKFEVGDRVKTYEAFYGSERVLTGMVNEIKGGMVHVVFDKGQCVHIAGEYHPKQLELIEKAKPKYVKKTMYAPIVTYDTVTPYKPPGYVYETIESALSYLGAIGYAPVEVFVREK